MPPEVVYELPDPSYEQFHWAWENEHAPGAQPPLTRDMFSGMWDDGDGPPRRIDLHGYSYFRRDDPDAGPDWPPTPDDGLTARERWEQVWLPRVEELYTAFVEFDPASVPAGSWHATLDEQAKEFGRVFAGVHGLTLGPSDQAANALIRDYVAHYGEERREDALSLVQGFDNCTLERATELWRLSRLVRERPDLRAALADWDGRSEAAIDDDFRQGFAAFLGRWGATMDGFVQDLPSWFEKPRVPLALILQESSRPDDASPALAAEARRTQRLALEAELRAQAESDPAAAALVETLAPAQEMLPIRENHNFLCDQRLAYASRQRWLAIGRFLAGQGLLERPEAVFYLQRDELVEALEGGGCPSAATLREREALQTEVRSAQPPAWLGAPPPAGAAANPLQLSGTPASPGQFRGRARIARSIEEAIELGADDVLVCVVTSPSWTNVFAVVGAVVTDAGSALSHPAIVAREYGIPAVVGTGRATRAIPDGATILVDGDRGLVHIEPD